MMFSNRGMYACLKENLRSQYQGRWGRVAPMAVAITFAIFVLSGMASAAVLKLGHTVPPTHVWHKVVDRFATNLEKESQGKFKINISPLSKLGKEPQMISLLQNGAIAMSLLPVAELSNREPSLLGWFLPYLFADLEAAGRATDLPVAKKMLKNLESQGLVGVGYTFAGMRQVLSLKPINAASDLVNQKIRSYPCPIFNDWWVANKAAPTALPLGEIAPSLNTSLLDAVDVDMDIVVGLKFYQQAGNLALTNHGVFPGVLLASKKWWDTLSPEDAALVFRVFKEAEKWGVALQSAAEKTNLEFLKKEGVNVTTFDQTAFRAVGDELSKKYIEQNDIIREFSEEVKQ